jgi:SulP family sulfate permease
MFLALLKRRPATLKDELLSGLTVALALVPEAVAFAIIAKVPIMVGLHAAFIMGLFAAIFGGRPGMISGATGAIAVVVMGLPEAIRTYYDIPAGTKSEWVGDLALQYLFVAVALAGLIQIGAGIVRLGKFIRLVPHSVMLGFVNGLAIIIFLAQFESFRVPGSHDEWLPPGAMSLMIGLAVGTMAVIWLASKVTKAVPAPLIGIVICTVVAMVLSLDTIYVSDLMDLSALSFFERLPAFHMPGLSEATVAAAAADGVTLPSLWSWTTLLFVLPFAGVVAAVGLVESLMTMTLIDEITETRGRGNRECVGQGLGNLTCGFFASMGGCAMIGQSMINIESGGRSRISGISAAVILLAILLFGGALIAQIPLAALVGVMFMVVIATFEWSSLRILHQVPRVDAVVIVMVAAVTVMTDNLALAVGIGVVIAALAFAWRQASSIHAHIHDEAGKRTYRMQGVLFFASVTTFRDAFDPNNDPDEVILDFADARVADHSGIEALAGLAEKYEKAGKKLHLRHLSPECTELLGKAKRIVDVDALTDPRYHVADDALG